MLSKILNKIMLLKSELTELQQKMAQVDLLTEQRPHVRSNFNEFLIRKLRNLKIKMYQEMGHKTPHIHIDYGRINHVASYSIVEARRLAGTLDTKYDQVVVEWIMMHKSRLLNVWDTVQNGQNPVSLIEEIKGVA